MRQLLLLGLLLLATHAWAQPIPSENILSPTGQRMMAGSSIAYGNNVPGERAIFEQKYANLPKGAANRAKLVQDVVNLQTRVADDWRIQDLNLVIMESGVEPVQSLYKNAKIAKTLGVKHPWVLAAVKAGDVGKQIYDQLPERWKPDVFLANRRQGVNQYFEGQFQETLDFVDAKATANQKTTFVNGIQNQYLKQKAITQLNDGIPVVSTSAMTVDQAIAKGHNADTKIEENNAAQVDLIASIMANQERNYITALETKKQITSIKADIKTINQELRTLNLTQQQIQQKQAVLTSLVEELKINTDLAFKATNNRLTNVENQLKDLSDSVLQKILQNSISDGDIVKRLEEYKSGARPLPASMTLKEVTDNLQHYKNLAEKQKIEQYVAIANQAVAYGQLGLTAMDRFNIGSEKDRKFISNVILAVRIGVAVGKAYSTGDPRALIQIGFELLSKPKPSPEMMMLQQIDQRLVQLEQAVFQGFESVHRQIEASHKDLAERINFVNQQMVDLRQQIANDHLETMTALKDVQQSLNFINTLVNGLAMHLPFSGNANDVSGNGNNGIVSGPTLTADRFGTATQAYSFLRSGSQYISVPNSTSLNVTGSAITICAWIKPDWQGGSTNMPILSKALNTSSTGRQYGLGTGSSTLLNVDLRTSTGTTDQSWSCPTCTLQPNVWQFVTIVYDGATIKWYKDGVPLHQLPKTGNIVSTTSDFIIGSFADRTQSFFNGAIDDVRIYNRALSITEIWDLVQL